MKTTTILILLFLSTYFLSAQKVKPGTVFKAKVYEDKNINHIEKIKQTDSQTNFDYNINGKTSDETRQQKSKLPLQCLSIGLDVPVFMTRSLVYVPQFLQDDITAHCGGIGYDLGLGLNIDFDDNFSLKFGLHKWNKKFNVNYDAYVDAPNGGDIDFFIEENGSFNYLGLYLKAHRNFNFFFVGGGFEVSLNKKYNTDYRVLDSGGNIVFSEKNVNKSPLIDVYNHQIDFSIIAGLRFRINDKLLIKPAIELISIPMSPIINTGVYSTNTNDVRQEVNITVFALKFGTVIEFELKDCVRNSFKKNI